ARELGVRVGQLRTWRLEFEKEAVTGIAKPDRSAAEDLEQLRRENAKLKMEIEILKKAAIYFARESKWSTPLSRRIDGSTACRLYARRCRSRAAGITLRGTAVRVSARSARLTSQLASGRSTKPAASRTALPGCTSN